MCEFWFRRSCGLRWTSVPAAVAPTHLLVLLSLLLLLPLLSRCCCRCLCSSNCWRFTAGSVFMESDIWLFYVDLDNVHFDSIAGAYDFIRIH